MFSGAALVTHIVAGVSLLLALILSASVLVLALWTVRRRTSPEQRAWLARLTKVGLLSGIIATAAYDLSKFTLSRLDSSPYNPFEVIHVFGVLFVGPSAPAAMIWLAGMAFHVLNGVSFGIGFCFFFRSHGILAGIAWGLFLELFQLTLYPGWLDIRSYREFVQISALSHILYGAVLAFSSQYGLREKYV